MYKTIASKVRMLYDGYRLLQTTRNPRIFYQKLRRVEELAEELSAFENEVSFRHKPSEILKELRENRAEYEEQFTKRYMAVVEDHVAAIRTENGREKARERAVERLRIYA